MSTRAGARLSFARCALLLSLGAGCGSGSSSTSTSAVCTPGCPNGTHCEVTGCVADHPSQLPDMNVGNDGNAGCSPACVAPIAYCNPSHVCVACLQDVDCPTGFVCRPAGAVTVCAQGCTDDSRCGGGQKCCGGACTDVSKDASNCGGCGAACSIPHATAACAGGMCGLAACNPGYGDCNKNPSDGCETNLHTDPVNCAVCGAKCSFPNARVACSDGCYIGACLYGFDDCNGKNDDGCETSVISDKKNCGACGNACNNPPHAQAACVNAACRLAACDPGFSDCDGNPANGCEVQTGIDKNNCGACGNQCGQGLVCINSSCTCPQCNFPNAKSACKNLVCVMGDCLPGWADCNQNPKDGCEVQIGKDKANCGACGNACPPMNGCIDGVCVMGCLNGQSPPNACDKGNDPETNSPYIVCQADCDGAYIAANNGGSYHADQICKLFGYSGIGSYGGTCGKVCGYCQDVQNPSCMNPQSPPHYDNAGNAGKDNFGIILSFTVQWQCLK
jgi:Cys-rich repeat protein